MENLTPDMFIVPVIVLMSVIVLYFYFLRKVDNIKTYRSTIFILISFAFMLNLVWEIAHAPLYTNFDPDMKQFMILTMASIADMFMVLLLFFSLGLLYKNVFWIENMNVGRISLLLFIGSTGAIVSEIWHITKNDWSYTESMPKLPWVDVGLSPVLQFTVLPLLIFFVTRKLTDEKDI